MEKNMTLPELLEDYRQNERKIIETEPSDFDTSIAVECARERQLLYKAANALEFATAAAPVVYHNATGETTVETLMEMKQALENLRCLTNNMDNQFVKALYCENFSRTVSRETFDVQQKKAVSVLDKLELLMDITPFQQAYLMNAQNASPISVADLEMAVNTSEALMSQYHITETDITARTMQVVADKYQRNELYVFQETTTRDEQQALPDVGLEIVESNDGYVMATNASPELIAQNPSLERELSERVRGNEVVHNEAPKETTIDMAKVGGNVKFEQYDDIGSLEKEKGVPTYEEKTEMAERTERETSSDGKTSVTTTTKSTKTEAYER